MNCLLEKNLTNGQPSISLAFQKTLHVHSYSQFLCLIHKSQGEADTMGICFAIFRTEVVIIDPVW